jgi:hypothetical protein
MAQLSDDQRAMLQLLLEGGQGYGDIASLLGTTEDQVRARSRAALRELGGADPDAEVGLTDYLLGQADPIGRADAARHLRNDPEANALATRLAAQLRLLAPKAAVPEIPDARPGKAPAPASAPASGEVGAPAAEAETPLRGLAGRFDSLEGRQRQLLAGLGAGGLVLLLVVLAVTGVIGGGGDDEDASAENQPSAQEGLTIVPLEPQGGSSASGQAVFARAGDQPVLQINLSGLEPTGQNQNYIVWLFASNELAFPLARDQVGEDGNLTGATPIPQELIGLLPQFGFIDVSLASNDETQQALQQAAGQQGLPPHIGQSVLRGAIPETAAEEVGGATTAPGGGTTTPTTPGATTTPGAGATPTAPAPTPTAPQPSQ